MDQKEWRNRIVGSGEEDPEQLLANPKNWRIHKKEQQDALEGLLTEVGWVQNVIVNRTTGHLVDGHMRVMVALRRNEKSIPVVYVDLTEKEEEIVLATLDPIGSLAKGDHDKLNELLSGAEVQDDGLDRFLASLVKKELRKEQPEVQFAQELSEEHQYVVLYFDNTVDWLNLQSLFPLPRVKAMHHKGKTYTATGIGRVVRGVEFLHRLEEHFRGIPPEVGEIEGEPGEGARIEEGEEVAG